MDKRLFPGKVLGLMVAVLVVGAVGSASASAAEWYVGGSVLSGSASLASATTGERVILEPTTGQFFIECKKGIELKGGSITAPGGGKLEHLIFLGCDAPSTSSCKLRSTTIESKALTLEAALGGKSPEDTVVMKPASGKTFAEFVLEGTSCGLSGNYALKGKVTFQLPKGREEAVEQELVPVHGEGYQLEGPLGNWNILEGKTKVKLASGKSWSFH